MSIRQKVLLPLATLLLILGAFTFFILLPSIETSFVPILRAELGVKDPLARERGHDHRQPGSPGILLYFDTAGTLINGPGLPAMLDIPNIARIPSPEHFLENEWVGMVAETSKAIGTDAVKEIVAVVVPTASARGGYGELRNSLFGLISGLAIALLGAGWFFSEWLERRVRAIRTTVGKVQDDSHLSPGDFPEDELGELEQTIVQTIRNLRTSQRELSRLQIVRSQFMANVSHEVRTPLFSLKGFLETLLDGGIDDPEVNRPFLEKSLHHAQRIDNLLRDLIDISRIESGEMRMSFRYFALSSLLEQIQRDHADAAANRLQILRIEVDDPSVEVLGDRERLRQALSNLVENAMKYSPEKSTVTIGVERRADRVRLTVKDNGPGIAAEHVPRIFERFYRVDPDRSRELGGTGLGLAIVKHIVEAHGSEIEVTTQAGNGSAFSFQLKA